MKKDEIKQKRPFAPGIQWQLMLFIGGITLFTLLLVWGIITYALEPQYNRNIRAKLDSKAAAITALIDQSDAEISSRTYQGLYLNDEFWSGVSQTFRDKKINVDGNCVDFSDSTLRCLKAYESMYPCLLHESTGAFGGEFGYNLDTRIAIQLRQKLFQDGSLYQIVKIGSSMQMCVGRLSADGQYGVIVSASLAQITTAAEVLRAILGPVALILLVLDLLLAILFSRWFTNPIRKLSNGAQEIASGNYDVMAAVMIGGMTPPCAIALATMLFKKKFTKEEREAGPTNFIMGLAFITEGAIPFAASDPVHVLPACIVGSGVAGAMSMLFNCTLMAPHGGIFVFPVMGNPLFYLLALVVGMAISTVLLGVLKKNVEE